MDPPHSPFVKRQFVRAETSMTAYAFRRGERIGPLAIENLSAGGALLVGGRDWRPGDTFDLELQVRGTLLRTSATIVRQARVDDVPVVGVRFSALRPDLEDAIQDAVVAQLERARAWVSDAVIAVTPRTEDIRMLMPAISVMGFEPIVGRTFLEALARLQDPLVLARALVVDAHAEQRGGAEILEWCAEAFPSVRRVLLLDDARAADLLSVGFGTTQAVIARPIKVSQLAIALGCTSLTLNEHATSSPPPAA